jgi:hypothetical protein
VTQKAIALTAAQRKGMSKAEQTRGVGQNRAAEVAEHGKAERLPAATGPVATFKPYFDEAVWGKDDNTPLGAAP